MTAEQRERLLPAFLADDRCHLARAVHEPEADTALGIHYHRPGANEPSRKTAAARSGDGWIVNGVKRCVANAPIARLFAVEADIEGHGPGTLLVPRDTPGLTVREPDSGPRWYHGACGEVTLEDCRVPADSLLRGPLSVANGRGSPQLQALNLGIGRAAYEAALDYADLRVQGGRRIIEHQAIGTKLAEIAIKLEVARNAIWKAAFACDHPDAYADRSLADLPLQTVAEVFAVGGDLRGRQGRGRVLRRHGRDARHAAAEIRARRPHLPAQRPRHRRRQAAHRRGAGGLSAVGGARDRGGIENGKRPWTSH